MKPTKALKEASTATKTKTRAHPPASEMVVAAITALNDRKGSSLASIKKYIVANYQCDIEKVAFFIRKFLKSAVENETLIQTKGTGASGSFKLPKPEKASKKKSEKKQPRDKSVSSKKSAKTAEMKDTEKKKIPKSAIAKKPRSAKSQVATKSPVKRTGKAPTTKPKSPSAKKAAKAKKVAKK